MRKLAWGLGGFLALAAGVGVGDLLVASEAARPPGPTLETRVLLEETFAPTRSNAPPRAEVREQRLELLEALLLELEAAAREGDQVAIGAGLEALRLLDPARLREVLRSMNQLEDPSSLGLALRLANELLPTLLFAFGADELEALTAPLRERALAREGDAELCQLAFELLAGIDPTALEQELLSVAQRGRAGTGILQAASQSAAGLRAEAGREVWLTIAAGQLAAWREAERRPGADREAVLRRDLLDRAAEAGFAQLSPAQVGRLLVSRETPPVRRVMVAALAADAGALSGVQHPQDLLQLQERLGAELERERADMRAGEQLSPAQAMRVRVLAALPAEAGGRQLLRRLRADPELESCLAAEIDAALE